MLVIVCVPFSFLIFILLEEFWRNWFYRVQVILTAYGLEMPTSSNKKKVENFPTDASQVSPVFVEETDYLNNRKDIKEIEKELGELGIHTSESNPEAWEEELKRELSELDPAKEGDNSLLSQNWEQELMMELGIKDSTSELPPTTSTTDAPTPTPTVAAISPEKETATNISEIQQASEEAAVPNNSTSESEGEETPK